MKNTKTCPKCSSKEIYTNAGQHNRGDRCSIPVSSWKGILVVVYTCTDCGYTEEYLDTKDKETIEKLKTKWKKVN